MENRNGTPPENGGEPTLAAEENPAVETAATEEAIDEVAELRQQLEAQNRRVDELSRAYADVLNDRDSFRRRLERENERQLAMAKGDMAEALLDAGEDLRLALRAEVTDPEAWKEGVSLVADGFFRRLEQMGLERIPTEGAAFDPVLHEAVDLVPTDDRDLDGKIVDEARAGWKMGSRVLRAPRVRVARYVPPAAEPDGAAEADAPSGSDADSG